MHGMVGLVVPVRRDDGTPAALKLQPLDPEHLGEGTALRTWAGQGSVLLLDESAGGRAARSCCWNALPATGC